MGYTKEEKLAARKDAAYQERIKFLIARAGYLVNILSNALIDNQEGRESAVSKTTVSEAVGGLSVITEIMAEVGDFDQTAFAKGDVQVIQEYGGPQPISRDLLYGLSAQ